MLSVAITSIATAGCGRVAATTPITPQAAQPATAPTTPSPAAAADPVPSTAPRSAANSGSPARSQAPVDACAVLPPREVALAFGTTRQPTPMGTGAICQYTAGAGSLTVTTGPGDAARASLQQEIAQRASGTSSLSGPGYIGLVRSYGQAGTPGDETGISLIKGNTLVQIVLTETASRTGSLVSQVLALGRAAARDLPADATAAHLSPGSGAGQAIEPGMIIRLRPPPGGSP